MNKLMTTIFWIVIIINVVTMGFILKEYFKVSSEPVTFNINGIPSLSEGYYGEISDLLVLGKRFANYHTYSKNYSCINYSNDFKEIAESLGFEVETVSGYKYANLTEGHQWLKLKIDYEPQTAIFQDYDKEYPYRR